MREIKMIVMPKLRFKQTDRIQRNRSLSAYSRNFSLAFLNWETNRQETRFAFTIFELDARKSPKHTLA